MKDGIDRRTFVKAAGSSFLAALGEPALASLQTSQALFASACKHRDGSFGVVLINEQGTIVHRFALPDRGHDIAVDPVYGRGVAFARRPGNFALVFDIGNKRQPQTIVAQDGRHFYGHGTFSKDGKRLYASENDFDNARGVVGIYDATDGFKRLGEFSSYGTGPHEILLEPHRNLLVIANGGIETHPDFGRAKLNIASMKPSLAFVDASNGTLVEKQRLPASMHKLSIRHMDIDKTGKGGKVYFGCQYEGAKTDHPLLAGEAIPGEGIKLYEVPADQAKLFGNYVGSVAVNAEDDILAVTLPKANRVAYFSTRTKKLVDVTDSPQSFGIAVSKSGFAATSITGKFYTGPRAGKPISENPLSFDNHLVKI